MFTKDMFPDFSEKFLLYCDFNIVPESPIKVEIKKTLFEEDFTEIGMIGYLKSIKMLEEETDSFIVQIHIDFHPFYDHNHKLLGDSFYPNSFTNKLNIQKELYTAEEAGYFKERDQKEYSCFVGDFCHSTDDVIKTLNEFLFIVPDDN